MDWETVELPEKVEKKKQRIDFMPLIKFNHLGKQYYQFCFAYKKAHPKCKSVYRLQYLFIKKCKLDFKQFIEDFFELQENIRVCKTPWLED